MPGCWSIRLRLLVKQAEAAGPGLLVKERTVCQAAGQRAHVHPARRRGGKERGRGAGQRVHAVLVKERTPSRDAWGENEATGPRRGFLVVATKTARLVAGRIVSAHQVVGRTPFRAIRV